MKYQITLLILVIALITTSVLLIKKTNELAEYKRQSELWVQSVEDREWNLSELMKVEKAIFEYVRQEKKTPPFGNNILEVVYDYHTGGKADDYGTPIVFSNNYSLTTAGRDKVFGTKDDFTHYISEADIEGWKLVPPIEDDHSWLKENQN